MQFEAPSHAPTGGGSINPVDIYAEFRSGKIPAIAAKSVEVDDSIGFVYWDKTEKCRKKIQSATFWVVGVFAQVSGSVKVSEKEYNNYGSNLVKDTRTDIISVYDRDTNPKKEVTRGLYRDVKAFLQSAGRYEGVGYKKTLICYDSKTEQVMSIIISQKMEAAMIKAIAAISNSKPEKINLLSLDDISSEIWGLDFTGELEKVNTESKPYDGKGDMFFAPVFTAGVIRAGGKYNDLFSTVSQLQDTMSAYVQNSQQYLSNGKTEQKEFSYDGFEQPTAPTAPAYTPPPMPTVERGFDFDTTNDLPF